MCADESQVIGQMKSVNERENFGERKLGTKKDDDDSVIFQP